MRAEMWKLRCDQCGRDFFYDAHRKAKRHLIIKGFRRWTFCCRECKTAFAIRGDFVRPARKPMPYVSDAENEAEFKRLLEDKFGELPKAKPFTRRA